MIKILGALMIACASVYYGFGRARGLKKRYDLLAGIQNALKLLETEIDFAGTTLKTSLKKIDKVCFTGGIFSGCAEMMDEYGAGEAWRRSVFKNKEYLTSADCETLISLGARLGMTDSENQIRNIRYVSKRLEGNISEAEDDYKRLSKLYRGGGVLIGGFIILMLL